MDAKDKLIEQLLQRIEALEKLVREQALEIASLKKRLGLNSTNSSKPPGSDGLNKPPRINTKSLREQGKLPSGGQKGHAGKTLKQVAHPDKINRYHLSACPYCNAYLKNHPIEGIVKRQVFDIPEPKIEVIEHQTEIKYCCCCDRKVQADFPLGVNAPVQYGSRIQSYSIYFQQQQLIPEDRVQQLLFDVFGVSITTATIVSFSQKLFKGLGPFMALVLNHIESMPRKHLDETGFRIGGKTQWLHVASNEALTYYHISPRRKSLLHGLKGIVCHDHWKAYYQLKGVKHALCNAHHLRELNALIEYDGEAWARKMKRFLYFSLKCKQHHEGHIPKEKQKRLFALYDRIVAEGRRYHACLPCYGLKPARGCTKQRVGYNLLLRLKNYRADVLRFITVADIPFSNNQAEQDIRMMKVKQKISGSFRTIEGAEMFVAIRSFISTMRKQGRNIFTSLTQAISGNVPQIA